MAKGFGEYSGVRHTPHALSWLIKQHPQDHRQALVFLQKLAIGTML